MKNKKWYWILIKGYSFYLPCLFMSGGDENADYISPGGLGDESNAVYLHEIEKIGPEITNQPK